jgi:hypothetical protein
MPGMKTHKMLRLGAGLAVVALLADCAGDWTLHDETLHDETLRNKVAKLAPMEAPGVWSIFAPIESRTNLANTNVTYERADK